jgi:hypothetical protein
MGRIIATEHISLDGVVEAPVPGDIGDHPHKGWVFDFEPGPFADQLKAMPKYVLSTTLERADWADSTILRGDLVTEVTRLA